LQLDSRMEVTHNLRSVGVPLPDDVVAVVLLDDLLEVRMLVPRLDQEKGRGGANPLVLGHGDVELLEAGRDPAFAQDLQPLVADLERRADALDALVPLAEERLVAPDSLRPALHRGDPTAGTGLPYACGGGTQA